jgi:hypothetical protein
MCKGVSREERDLLRALAREAAQIAALPVHREKMEMWRRLNDLEEERPMVWINEIPWHEMNVGDELLPKVRSGALREQELYLRRTIYMWKHMRVDMIVEPKIFCPLAIRDTGFGIHELTEVAKTDADNAIVSRHYHQLIKNDEDVEKIRFPRIEHDEEETKRLYDILSEIFDGILPVEMVGRRGPWDHVGGSHYVNSLDDAAPLWFAPWDILVTLYGVQEALTDLILRPDLIRKTMDRLVSAYLHRLDQYERLGLLSLNNGNVRVGSGGLGYTSNLPQPDCDPNRVRAADSWGMAAAQIFSEVSPAMHEEFALEYEMRWLKRFGLTYYGCCEPLHRKIGILSTIPNLRKVSMSPWVQVDKAAEALGRRYIYSMKPRSQIFAEDVWNPARARESLVRDLEMAKRCNIEVIMKDISTVRYEPQRLWEWARMASEVVERAR